MDILHNVDLLKSMTWQVDAILFRLLMWVLNPLVYVCKIAYQYILTTNWYNPLFSFPKTLNFHNIFIEAIS